MPMTARRSFTANLDFHKAIISVTQMDYRVTFEVRHVAIMGYLSHQGIGIGSEVPDSKCLEQAAEGVEVVQKVIRAYA